MNRLTLTASLALAVVLPASAQAKPPTRQHARKYNGLYAQVRHQFGKRAPGRNLMRDGYSNSRGATDADVVTSIGVLQRMLAPPPVVQTATVTSTATPTASSGSTGATGGNLESCIIQHESGGDPNAVSGQYRGIGQWSPSAWAQDGGTQYASSPTGASYSQQLSVLNGEGASGMRQQQGQYDGCSG